MHDTDGDVLDLFGGPGGWDVAAQALGIDPLGIEWDPAACATREAAGLRTLQADVSALNPLDFAPVVGCISSAPCPSWSMAGKGEGRAVLGFYRAAMERMAAGETIGAAELDAACGDERAHLVLEPLRWALALRPRWVACEQVEPVLPLWEAMAAALRQYGYWTAVGVCSSEQFGVPQTRRRAILLASLGGPVALPAPTHQRYIAPRRRDEPTESLFDPPEPVRIVAPEDRHLLPWVSMAEALNFGMTHRPSVTVAGSNGKRWGAKPLGSGSGGQRILDRARTDGVWKYEESPSPSPSPSPSVTGGGGSTGGVEVFASKGARARAGHAVLRMTTVPNSALRDLHDPAPTVAFGHDAASAVWVTERPATTVNGDPRISEPGHHDSDVSGSQQANAVRVSLAEALVLQSFDPAYPVQGTKTKQYEQVGNAIPPPLAWHVLRAAIGA